MEQSRRTWAWFEDIELRADLFEELGRNFEREHPVRRGKVGSADSRLFSQPAAVDFAVGWLRDRGR
jgi:aminoglycoside 3-N-acetyltransferase